MTTTTTTTLLLLLSLTCHSVLCHILHRLFNLSPNSTSSTTETLLLARIMSIVGLK
uniref:Uncharacterized protein n=1 Tax=Manihot esculenta TaxID=3983 RepID=A0A2C9VET1_MANES